MSTTSIISNIAAFIGVLLAIFFYIKSRRTKCIKYSIKDNNLVRNITERDKHLKVLYDNQQVENVTVSRVAIWNAGTETIRPEDLASNNSLRIEWDSDIDILNSQLIYRSNEDINIIPRFPRDKQGNYQYCNIAFDFLDKNEGCVIQVVHNGLDSKSLHVRGRIIGGNELQRISISRQDLLASSLNTLGIMALFVAAVNLLRGKSEKDFLIGAISLGLCLLFFSLFYLHVRHRDLTQRFLYLSGDVTREERILSLLAKKIFTRKK